MSRHCATWMILFTLTLATGCGEQEVPPEVVPPLQPVTGTITLDDKPTAGIAITLLPADKTEGNGASGITDAAGKFELKYRTGDPGVPVGDYVAVFSKMALPDGSPIPAGMTAADSGARELIPERYRKSDSRENRLPVTEGGKTVEFKLKSR